jgi:hypothetical protein
MADNVFAVKLAMFLAQMLQVDTVQVCFDGVF